MNSTTLGVVAGVVVFAIGGLHGLLVLTAAIVSWWIVRTACVGLLVQEKERAEEREPAKQRKTATATERRRAQKTVVGRRFAIIMALLLSVLAATLAAHLGAFSDKETAEHLTTKVKGQRTISPLAAFGWLLVVLTPAGLVSWVFIKSGQERRRSQAEQRQGNRQREEAQRREAEREAKRREAETRAEQERRAEERSRQAEQEREAERRRQQQGERAAKQFEENVWWSVLDVSPRASADEIRRAYHRKIKQCHPDRVAGLAPEFLDLAERHTRCLNAAYEKAIRARRGAEAR